MHNPYSHKTIQDLYVTYSFVYFIGDFSQNPLVSNSDGRYLPLLKILIDDGICAHFHSLLCIQMTKNKYFRFGVLLLQYLWVYRNVYRKYYCAYL